MHRYEVKKSKLKSILKLALIIVLILILGILFINTWIHEYNIILRFQYIFKGNVFMMIIYMILTYVFMLVFDCNNVSEIRVATMIFTETLSFLTCNIFVYFVMIIPAAALGFMPIAPILLLSLKDFIVVILWSFLVYYTFKTFFPAKNVLLITDKSGQKNIIKKFSNKGDIFVIKEIIEYDNNIDEIYNKCESYSDILIGDITSETRNDILKHCFNNSRNIYILPKLSDVLIKYSDDLFVFDSPVYLSANFGLSLESKILKRFFDIIVSLIVLIVFIPFWIIIAFAIKIEDGGPVLFLQERVTLNNKIFKIIKFRSMKLDDDDRVLPTLKDDDRITVVGRFIRRFHLDEIPQFLNVLKGEMSVVGPRPERKEHVELYQKEIKEFEYRHKVKAGITGLAQIYGKYNTSAIDKLKLDLIYIKKYSFLFDVELMFRTLKVFFIGDNTEGFDIEDQEYIKNNA